MQNPSTDTEVIAASPRRKVVSGKAILAVVVLAAGAGAAAYWQEELSGFIALQGWDRESPKRVVRDFIRTAHASDNASIENALARNQFTLERASNGQVKTIKYQSINGQRTASPKELVPAGEPKEVDLVIRRLGDRVFYSAVVQFANGKWGVLRVERLDGSFRITALPEVFDEKRPQDLSLY